MSGPACSECGRLACDCSELADRERVRQGYHKDCAFCDAVRREALPTRDHTTAILIGIGLLWAALGFSVWMLL